MSVFGIHYVNFFSWLTTYIKVWSYWEVETSELFCLKEMRQWAWGGEN